jgi:hypothetical protein
MQGDSPSRRSTPAGAVFLSYASQDAEAAQRICNALRAAGIEVCSTKVSCGAARRGIGESASKFTTHDPRGYVGISALSPSAVH